MFLLEVSRRGVWINLQYILRVNFLREGETSYHDRFRLSNESYQLVVFPNAAV